MSKIRKVLEAINESMTGQFTYTQGSKRAGMFSLPTTGLEPKELEELINAGGDYSSTFNSIEFSNDRKDAVKKAIKSFGWSKEGTSKFLKLCK